MLKNQSLKLYNHRRIKKLYNVTEVYNHTKKMTHFMGNKHKVKFIEYNNNTAHIFSVVEKTQKTCFCLPSGFESFFLLFPNSPPGVFKRIIERMTKLLIRSTIGRK